MRLLTLVGLFLCGTLTLQSQTQYTGPDGGDWFTASNWNNGLPANGNDPLVGGGVSVLIDQPLSVDFSITNFGGIVVEAAVTNGGTISNSGTFDVAATGSLVNNGTLNNFGTASFAGPSTFVNETGASFTNSGPFTLNTTLVNRGSITNNGTIDAAAGTVLTEGNFDNAQTLTTESLTVQPGSTFTNNFGSNLNITGAAATLLVDGNFNNLGTVSADGVFTVNGTFSNSSAVNSNGVLTINAGATFNSNSGTVTTTGGVQNFGTFINGFQLVNSGSFNNFGQFNNNNLIENQTGGTWTNRSSGTLSMGFGSRVANAGTFSNENAWDSFGTIENNGVFSNAGNINSFSGSLIDNNSGFTNNGAISTNDQVLLDGTFTNNGTININGGSVWRNADSFTNSTGGTVNVQQDFVNLASGTATNNGRWTNLVRTQNEGNFVNNALFEILAETLTNTTGAIFTNNELLLLRSGNLLNEGDLVNNAEVFSDECSTIKNTGNIDNPGHFELDALLFQQGTVSGNAIDCQGCYVHTSTGSDAPSVCQNGTYGTNIDGDVKVYAPSLIAFENFDSCSNIVYLAEGLARPVFSCSDIGTILTVDMVLRTRLGDSLTCTAEVTPVDGLEPQFNFCPKDIIIFTPDATATATWDEPTAVDNCTATSLVNNIAPGADFPIGITGVTYTATDDYGNINNCQFRVDVRQTGAGGNCTGDTDAPTFANCPADINVSTGNTSAVVGWTPPTPQDGCYPLTLTTDFTPGQTFGVGSTTVVYSATDGNGNEGTCEFTVTVGFDDPCLVDNVPPSFTNCPPSIFRPTNAAIGGSVAVWNEPGIFDLCGLASVTATNASGEVFAEGQTTVTYTAEDNSGNVSTCQFFVTVGANPCPGDLAAPNFADCPANVAILTSGNSGVATWAAPTATSTCTPLSVTSNYSPGATFQLGVTPVIYSASDLVGNVGTCSFTVTVQNDCQADNVNPVITGCPSNLSVASVGGFGTATWTEPTATDNCDLTTFSASFQPGASFPEGVTTVIYTAADLQGNIATCEFNVTVVAAPGCTSNASPIEGTTEVDAASVTLSWTTENAASTYDVFLGTSNPPTNLVAANVNGTSTTVAGLNGGTTYFWYVVPKNVAGSATGCGSSATSFRTAGGGNPGGDCNFEAIFIAGSTSLNASDAFAKARLESLGFTVTVIDDNQSQTSDADGKGLIVISSTTNSGNVNTKFRDVAVPVICWEPWLYDDFKMTGTGSGSNYGTQGNVSQINIENSSHPLAAGLSGTVNMFASGKTVSWGKPGNGAVDIGNILGNSGRKMLFAYDTGAQMIGSQIAPAPRVGIFLHNSTSNSLNANGLKLFDAAVRWATGTADPGTPCDDGNAGTENDVIGNDFCTCAGTPVCDGAVTGYFFTGANDVQLFALEDGGSYPLNLLPAAYNIEVVTSGTHESARIVLDGPVSNTQVENLVPWHAFGTGGSNTLTPGAYTLTATLFSEDNAGGATCSETSIGFTIENNDPCVTGGPVATVSKNDAACGQNNGSITFAFPDANGRTHIEFSIDGGNTYPYHVPDNSGSTTVNNVPPGTYDVWVRWGNNDCPTDLGTVTVGEGQSPPNAVCQNINLQLPASGQSVQISGADVDGGSAAGCGNITSLNISPNSFSEAGTYTVTLTVTNSFGLSADCTATVTVDAPTGPCSVPVVFDNQADCQVEVYWFNGSSEVLYNTLNSGQGYTQQTYDTHIWRVRNASSGELILQYVTAGCNQQSVVVVSCSVEACKGAAGTGLTREVWNGISGVDLSALTGNANYPDNPSFSDVVAGSIGPVNIGDNYGSRVRGFITPSQSGTYHFYVTGDDQTELYLSTNGDPTDAALISNIPGWTNQTQFYKYASQKSAGISLTAGQDYYVELRQKEGGGGDHWGIHWTANNGTPTAIPVARLSPLGDCEACNPEVLFVVGNTNLNSGDAWVNNRLQSLGYNVQLVSEGNAATSQADGKGLVVISSTVNSGTIGNKFTQVSTPVVTWESYLLDNLKMTGTTAGYDYGGTNGVYQLQIDDPAHPLAAGLSGTVQVFTNTTYARWGWLPSGGDALRIARLAGQSDYGILAYEEGDALVDGSSAPGRRLSLWLDNTTATLLTANGAKLFDAAIEWASGCTGGVGNRSIDLRFAATKNHFHTDLLWTTNAEDIGVRYIIERSADGEMWEQVLEVENENRDAYRRTDLIPLEGRNLYRLCTYLANGTMTISREQEVIFPILEDYEVFPNPARGQVYVDLSRAAGEEVLVRLFDGKGHTVQEWEVTAEESPMPFALDVNQSGQYLLWMYVDDRRPVTKKVMVERN